MSEILGKSSEEFTIRLGTGQVYIEPVDVSTGPYGYEVALIFREHNTVREIGSHVPQDECDKIEEWVHLLTLKSASVDALNVAIESLVKIRNRLVSVKAGKL